jgi:uncharacterized DUF497 family protein
MYRFVWDESKRLTNLRKHAIDFVDALTIFDGDAVTIEDDRFDYDEQRFMTLGLLGRQVIVVIHTERGETIRIISARKALSNEQKRYFQQFND